MRMIYGKMYNIVTIILYYLTFNILNHAKA